MFQTERLSVRRLVADDFDDLLEVYSDPEAMRFVGDGQPITRAETGRWIEVTRSNQATRGYGMSHVSLTESGALVGFCGLVHPGGQEEPEVKYALLRPFWGRGLATELVRGMIAWGRREHDLDVVIATVDARNAASLRVLAKAGLRERGRATDPDGTVVVTLATAPHA